MITSLVMTILGPDRPGLVRVLSDAVASHGGNWLESRMARLAGQFAGVVRVECAPEAAENLIAALDSLSAAGLSVHTVREAAPPAELRRTLSVDVVGNDRPGIVRELAAAIANAGGNIEELTTGLESAPHAGHPIFRARGIISIPEHSDAADVTIAIENLGSDLSVDIA
jgi:glycine cleavage system regulatory protein